MLKIIRNGLDVLLPYHFYLLLRKMITPLIIILFVGATISSHAAPLKIKFAYPVTANYPYTTGNGSEINWDKPGVALEMLKLIEKELEIEISIARMPWKRGLIQMEQGHIDALFSASFKQERFKYGLYPMKGERIDRDKKFYDLCYCFYKMKGSLLIWDEGDLKNQTRPIGAMRGYSIVNTLREKGVSVVENDNELSNFKMLKLGRIDAVATYSYAGDALLNHHHDEFKDVVKMDAPFEAKSYYLMFSYQFMKENPDVAEKIWDAIRKIRESEKFEQLFSKY